MEIHDADPLIEVGAEPSVEVKPTISSWTASTSLAALCVCCCEAPTADAVSDADMDDKDQVKGTFKETGLRVLHRFVMDCAKKTLSSHCMFRDV